MFNHFLKLLPVIILMGCQTGIKPETTDVFDKMISNAPPDRHAIFFPKSSRSANLAKIARNGPYETWITIDRVTISYVGRILVGSRGLGFDLIAADWKTTADALQKGQAMQYQKRYQYLDAEDYTKIVTFSCAIGAPERSNLKEIQTLKTQENCEADGIKIQNIFWRDNSSKKIIASKQWISDKIGYIVTNL